MTVKERLEQFARAVGLPNPSALAREAGISEGAMRQHISRDRIPYEKAVLYNEVCPEAQTTPDWLMTGKGSPPIRVSRTTTYSRGGKSLPEQHAEGTLNVRPRTHNGLRNLTGDVANGRPISRGMVADFPVYRAAESGGGVVALSQDPEFHVDRPGWSKSSDDFSFFVWTDAMGPHPGRGDRVEVNASIPPVAGDLVVLVAGERPKNWRAVLRELVSIGDKHWRVKQYHPEKVDNLDRETWHTAYKVGGINKR